MWNTEEPAFHSEENALINAFKSSSLVPTSLLNTNSDHRTLKYHEKNSLTLYYKRIQSVNSIDYSGVSRIGIEKINYTRWQGKNKIKEQLDVPYAEFCRAEFYFTGS